MLQIALGIIVAIWFYRSAVAANSSAAKWVTIGLLSYLLPGILWAVIYIGFIKQPALQWIVQHGTEQASVAMGLLLGLIGPGLGLLTALVIKNRYLVAGSSGKLKPEVQSNKIKLSFWVISIILLLWQSISAFAYVMQMSADFLALMPENQEVLNSTPHWVTVAHTISVVTALIGCILLLTKRSEAILLFLASLTGFLITLPYSVWVMNKLNNLTLVSIILGLILPVIVFGFQIWYAKHATNKGWLN